MRIDFDRKSLVVEHMPMQHIEFGMWHRLDKSLDGADFQKMSGGIDHNTSVFVSWLIFNLGKRKGVLFNQLRQSFHGVYVSRVVIERQQYSILVYF